MHLKQSAVVVHNSQGDQSLQTEDQPLKKLRQSLKDIRSIKAFSPGSPKMATHEFIESEELQEYNPRKFERGKMTFNEVNDEELSRYKADWYWSFFFEFLIYHILFYIFLGPLIVLIFFQWPGMNLMRNMRFYSFKKWQFYQQVFLWVGSLTGGLYYFIAQDSVVTFTEILFMWAALFMRCVVIAAKYATLSHQRIQLYKSEELPDEIFDFDLMFADWSVQSGKVLFLEQYRSMRRHEFEQSSYKFDFLIDPSDHTKKQIKSTQICFYFEWAQKQPLNSTDSIQPDGTYNGFYIFGYLVEKYQKKHPISNVHKGVLLQSFLLAITPVFIRIPQFIQNPVGATDACRMLINIATSLVAFYGALIFLMIGIYDFQRKFFLLDQCLYMLQAKKVSYASNKKLLPTINFNNSHTLQAWSMFRAICFDYGQTYNIRTQGFYSIVFLGVMTLIVTSLCLILDLMQLELFTSVLLLEMAALLIIYTTLYLYHGAGLNEYFDQFETLLDDVKSIYLDIQRVREKYFEEKIQPVNKIHKIFVNMLKDQIGENTEVVKQYIEEIVSELDDNIRLINYDRRNNNFKLYGVTISFNLLKSALVALSTIYSYAIQQRFQNGNV